MNKQETKTNKKTVQNYARFLALVFQMAVIILLFSYLGYWLENQLHIEKNYLTAAFSLVGVFIGLYLFFKQLPKE